MVSPGDFSGAVGGHKGPRREFVVGAGPGFWGPFSGSRCLTVPTPLSVRQLVNLERRSGG